MAKIWIDPGHGGSEPGAKANGIIEKDINLTASLKLKEHLVRCGFDVGITRDDDKFIDVSARGDLARDAGANLFISVHHNAYNGKAKGYQVIHQLWSPYSKQLAGLIGEEFDVTGQILHSIYSRRYDTNPQSDMYDIEYYAVLRSCSENGIPAIITEYAFIDSDDYISVNTAEKLYKEAEAIAKAVCKYYGVEYVQEVNPEQWKLDKIDILADAGIINDREGWKKKINEPIPVWALASMLCEMLKK